VERGIEYRDLRQLAEQLLDCAHAAEIRGHVQRREIHAVVELVQHIVVDEHRLSGSAARRARRGARPHGCR
jgi:lipoate-protein ligase A